MRSVAQRLFDNYQIQAEDLERKHNIHPPPNITKQKIKKKIKEASNQETTNKN